MNPSDASQPDSFSWSAFEDLEDFAKFDTDLDDLEIPDSTYRQLKELNQSLIEKARHLARFEAELERQKAEFELVRQSFEAVRIQSTRESTESRLDRMIRHDRKAGDHEARNHDPQELADELLRFVQSADAETIPTKVGEFASPDSLNDRTIGLEAIDFVEEVGSESTPEYSGQPVPSDEELARFRNSVRDLKEKSEVISAVFVELDQMVRDLNRQQELLDEMNLSPNSNSSRELSTVNHQLKRRFRRLSRQIKIH